MHAHRLFPAALILITLGGADQALAQAAGSPPAAIPAATSSPENGRAPERGSGEVDLIFEREVFVYPITVRRDPFTPLLISGLGPRFEDLALRGVIFSDDPAQSIALLADKDDKIYRVRRGETVGNSRVIDIRPLRVLFAVNNFGVVRQEALELKRNAQQGDEG